MSNKALWQKSRSTLCWAPAYGWQRVIGRSPRKSPVHLIIGLADHFEPAIMPGAPGTYAARDEQERRVEYWCREYPHLVNDWRDSGGRVFRHTYFFPAEQYDKALVDRLAEHCHAGWGEIEIHLHHGVERPDTPQNTRRLIVEFRDTLLRHGCLSLWNGEGSPRYGFVHGNWALANSADGRFCGVDDEMQILSETGCYADFTLPSAPSVAQIGKINALYECSLPLSSRAPHRRGRDLRSGVPPSVFPLIIQGPLSLSFMKRRNGWPFPYIENGAVAELMPPTLKRLRLWRRAAITVQGQPDWIFIKLHCHGMDPRDRDVMLGAPMRLFLRQLTESVGSARQDRLHFVTMREMTNMILAACDGRSGDPNDFRDYRLRLISGLRHDGRCAETRAASEDPVRLTE